MWMVVAVIGGLTAKSVGLAAMHPACAHSSNEPGELSQWLNIVLVVVVIIIIINNKLAASQHALALKSKGERSCGYQMRVYAGQ